MEKIFEELKKKINGEVVVDEESLEQYSGDYSIFKIKPQAIVFPKNAEDVGKLVQFVKANKKKNKNLSITARSAGTDMSGGPLNDSIIVSFMKHMNEIKEITSPSAKATEGTAIVEPGVYFRDLEKELDKRGLMYPPAPASKNLCALGGMVSNNSGGERSLSYGKTENFVKSLKVVLSDGKLYEIKPISATELKKKIKSKSFEGVLYRKIYNLIEKNYDAIKKAKPDVSKNSAGYDLWNVWDRKTFDLTKLFVGAQGTLGLITEAKLRMVKKKKFSRLIVVFAKTLEPVPELVEAILPFKPESIESFDDKTMGLAMRFLPSILKIMKGSAITLAFKFIPEFLMILKGGFPKMIILIEVASDSESELFRKMDLIKQAALKFPVQARVIKDKAEEEKYWTMRRQSFALLHSHVKGLEAASFVEDIIVKPEFLTEVLPKVNEILDEHKDKLIYTIAGHPGNGNFHIIPLVDLKDPAIPGIISELMDKIYKLVIGYGGSITAEHNDGLIRGPYLKMMYGEKIYKLFEETKKIFDPLDIFNPRKKIGVDKKYSFSFMKKQ